MKTMMQKMMLLVVAVCCLTACNEKDTLDNPTTDVKQIAKLVTFHGNRNSNTVIINTQGGPETALDERTLGDILTKAGIKDQALVVNVHQVQTAKPSLFTSREISFDQAKKYDQESVANLKKVVDFYKAQPKKKVYVLGISFGAFMTQELIANYGKDVADGYLISVGRLDIDKETWEPFSKGMVTRYVFDASGNYTIEAHNIPGVKQKNMSKLAAGLGYHRYTKEWAALKDLSKVTYVYGDRDAQVGPLSSAEIAFLKSKKAKVVLVPNGGHGTAIEKTATMMKTVFNIK